MSSSSLVPGIYNPNVPDAIIEVSSEQAYAMARCLARREGLMVGVSAAANVVAALQVARDLHEGVVVTMLCDSAARYLSETFWESETDRMSDGAGI
jgi:cysteine synthase B